MRFIPHQDRRVPLGVNVLMHLDLDLFSFSLQHRTLTLYVQCDM